MYKRQETLDRICIAAEELFSEKGYYDTGITDIVTRAGIAQGTFYIYFNDKKSVFVYLIRKLGSELKESIRANIRAVSYTHLDVYKRQL